MAQGDVFAFQQFFVDVQEGLHDLENDEFRVAIIDAVVTPLVSSADPRWGAGGGTNFATNEVTPGGNYVANGALAANPSVILSGGAAIFDADDPPAWAAAAGNPNDARWAILYNNTDVGKRCVAFIDLGAVFDMTTGDLDINFGAGGIHTMQAA